jgi:hypothetical protein
MDRGIFDVERVRALFRAHQEGRADHGIRLWTLINVCSWAERWLDASAGS